MPISPSQAATDYANTILDRIKDQLARHNFSMTTYQFHNYIAATELRAEVVEIIRKVLKEMGYGEVKYTYHPCAASEINEISFEVEYIPGTSKDFDLSKEDQYSLDHTFEQIDSWLRHDLREFSVDDIVVRAGCYNFENRALYEIFGQYGAAGWNVELITVENHGETSRVLKFTPK